MFLKVSYANSSSGHSKFRPRHKVQLDDFDVIKPCFFEQDSEEDFYTPLPSEAIWKKFELIPTPPRSPTRDDEAHDSVDGYIEFKCPAVNEKLNLVSELVEPKVVSDFTDVNNKNLRSKLIQDCMWSGKHNCVEDDVDDVDVVTTCEDVRKEAIKKCDVEIVKKSPCVDPTTVFPYPVSEDSSKKRALKSCGMLRNKSAYFLSNAGSDGSDINEDDDEDDAEEEIDVVSVEKTIPGHVVKPGIKVLLSSSVKLKGQSVVKPLSQLTAQSRKDSLSVNSSPVPHFLDIHSYSMKRKSVSLPASPQAQSKRFRQQLNFGDLHKAVQKLRSHPVNNQSASDSEEPPYVKRAQHNVLERQRRTDLKMSFFQLRDMLPDLQKNERAPKVVILQKATNYVHSLTHTNAKLKIVKKREIDRKNVLLSRLEALQRTYLL